MLTVQARAGASDMLEEAARWAKRNAKALKLARYALRHGAHHSMPTVLQTQINASLFSKFVMFRTLQRPFILSTRHWSIACA